MYSCWSQDRATPSAEPTLLAPDVPHSLQRAGCLATTISKRGYISMAFLPTGAQTSSSHCAIHAAWGFLQVVGF